MRVDLMITCLGENFYPRAAAAAVRVLEHLGHRVGFPAGQTCCGQPMYNNGFHAEAVGLAARTARLFADAEAVVTLSASCAAMVRRHMPELLRGSADHAMAERLAGRTFEFGEFLIDVLRADLRSLGVKWPGVVTSHTPCHFRDLGVADRTPTLLGQIEGLEFREPDRPEQCCGFGGTFAVAYPAISGALARDKAGAAGKVGAEWMVCNEPGCGMNIAGMARRMGAPTKFISVPEIIAEGLGLMPREFA